MTNNILRIQGTPVTWAASGGTYTMTLTSLANSAGRKGVVHDFGATIPTAARWELKTDFNASPTAGNPMYLYWVSSSDNSAFDATLSSADAAMSDLNAAKKMLFIGTFFAENNTTSQIQSGEFVPPARYGFPAIYNASGQALSGTAGDHLLTIVPLIDQVQ